jgi:hypothetical protein
MRVPQRISSATLLTLALSMTIGAICAQDTRSVAFPESYRSWQNVRSIVIGPEHPTFARRGGIHHYYANEPALVGYRTGKFPSGSVIVDEGVFAKEGEGSAKGLLLEGERRTLDVMVKDDRLYKDTEGWGFEHFEAQDRSGRLTAGEQTQCYKCHAMARDRDFVFSKIRL